MGVVVMWGALIGAIITIAGAGIQAGLQNKANREAREEARGIADMNRRDLLQQQKIDNRFTNQQLDLGQKKIDFALDQQQVAEDQMTENMGNLEKQRSFLNVTNAANNLTQARPRRVDRRWL